MLHIPFYLGLYSRGFPRFFEIIETMKASHALASAVKIASARQAEQKNIYHSKAAPASPWQSRQKHIERGRHIYPWELQVFQSAPRD